MIRGRRSLGGLIALCLLATACGDQATPTHPSPAAEISAGGLNASGSVGTFTLQVTKNGTGGGTVTSSAQRAILQSELATLKSLIEQ